MPGDARNNLYFLDVHNKHLFLCEKWPSHFLLVSNFLYPAVSWCILNWKDWLLYFLLNFRSHLSCHMWTLMCLVRNDIVECIREPKSLNTSIHTCCYDIHLVGLRWHLSAVCISILSANCWFSVQFWSSRIITQ